MTHLHLRAVAVSVLLAAFAASAARALATADPSAAADPAAQEGTVAPAQSGSVKATEQSDVRSIEMTRAELDRQFIIGPTRLDALKLRSRWQTSVSVPAGSALSRIYCPLGDSVFVQDSAKGITRLKADSGDRIWRDVVAGPKDTILGIERGDARGTDVVVVTTDVDLISLECANGIRMGAQRVTRYPATGSVRMGSYLIYGTRVGQVAWQQYVVGHAWKSNSIGGSIKAQPILTPVGVAAGSTDGIVALFDPATTASLWRFKAGGSVDGALSTDGMRVFCTARDNYVYAIDISRGRTAWKFRCDSALGTDTACLGDTVYVRDADGMIALAADGGGKLDGTVRWKAPIKGTPIALTGSGAVAWDGASSTYTLFDPSSGAVRSSVVLDGVVDVRASGTTDMTIHFVAADGRVQQTQPTEMAPSQAGAMRTASSRP